MRNKSEHNPANLSLAHATRVGSAELRANLAKYLKLVKGGRPLIVQERGKSAYVLLKYEEQPPESVLGCLRDRTEYVRGTVVNAKEAWSAGELP